MKTNITITLDKEIVEALKREDNYSSLINEQLKAYYETKECQNKEILKQKIQENKQKVKEINKKRREYEEQLKKIAEKEKKIQDFLKSKNLTRAKIIKQIEKRREMEKNNPYMRKEYFISVEEEADSLLKGGALR